MLTSCVHPHRLFLSQGSGHSQKSTTVRSAKHGASTLCTDGQDNRPSSSGRKLETDTLPLPLSPSRLKRSPSFNGYTNATDLVVGRLAMVGFTASLVGELVTGQGPLGQLNVETGIPLAEIDGLVIFIIAFNITAGLVPLGKRRYLPEEEELEPDETKNILQKSYKKVRKIWKKASKKQFDFQDAVRKVAAAFHPSRVLAVVKNSGSGFRVTESAIGRWAQFGFAGCLLGEALTGKGALAQIGIETGFLLEELQPTVLLCIAVVVAVFGEGLREMFLED